MPTLTKRGSGTPTTVNTTWTTITNIYDGTPPANPATYAVWTNSASTATGQIFASGYDFSAIPAGSTINSVTATLRHFENNITRIATVRMVPERANQSALGAVFDCVLSTSARSDTSTPWVIALAELQAAGFHIKCTALRAAVTQSATFNVDHCDVTVDYTEPVPSITQASYRWYDDGTETGSVALAVQDTPATGDVTLQDGIGQLRIRLQSTTAVAAPTTDDWQLQWEKNASGTWTNVVGVAAEGLADSTSARSSSNSLITPSRQIAQSFLGNGQLLTRAGFLLQRTGAPTGTMDARIYAHAGTYGTSSIPTGTALATSTTTVDSATVVTGAGTYNFYYFDFAGTLQLQAGTPYCIAITAPSGVVAGNYISLGDGNATGHAGNESMFSASTWSVIAGYDSIFEVYTRPVVGTVIPYASANLTDGATTTNRLGAGSGSFVAGKVSETGLVSDLGWTANNYTEIVYSLDIVNTDVANGDTLRFRVLRNGATTDFTYTQVPTINIVKASVVVNGTSQVILDFAVTVTGTIVSGEFTPDTLPNLVGWYDASDAANFVLSGANVTQWNDLSGGVRNLTVGLGSPTRISTDRPAPVVNFSGTAQSLRHTGSNIVAGTTFTIAIVVRLNAIVDYQRIASFNATGQNDYETSSGCVAIYQEPGKYPVAYRSLGTMSGNHAGVIEDAWNIIMSVFDGANHTMYVDGSGYSPVGSTGTFDIDQFHISESFDGGDPFTGDIAEIVICGAALDTTQRDNLNDYFDAKWFGVVAPIVTGTAQIVIDLGVVVQGTVVAEIVTGTSVLQLSISSTTVGTRIVSGTSVLALNVTTSATGIVVAEIVTGTSTLALGINVVAQGTVVAEIVTGVSAIQLGINVVAQGIVIAEIITGVSAINIDVQVNAIGTVIGAPVVNGTSVISLSIVSTTIGTRILTGSSAVSVAFASTTVGTRIVNGTSVIALSVTTTSTGIKIVHGTSTIPIIINVTAVRAIVGVTTGTSAIALGINVVATGTVIAEIVTGTSIIPINIGVIAQGTRVVTANSTVSISVSVVAIGQKIGIVTGISSVILIINIISIGQKTGLVNDVGGMWGDLEFIAMQYGPSQVVDWTLNA